MLAGKKKRGRPRKPAPLTDMTAARFSASKKGLRVMIIEEETSKQLASFLVNAPRTTKSGKSGWSFSQKLTVSVDGVDVACQCTGTIQGIRSDQWRGQQQQEEEEARQAAAASAVEEEEGSEADGSSPTIR